MSILLKTMTMKAAMMDIFKQRSHDIRSSYVFHALCLWSTATFQIGRCPPWIWTATSRAEDAAGQMCTEQLAHRHCSFHDSINDQILLQMEYFVNVNVNRLLDISDKALYNSDRPGPLAQTPSDNWTKGSSPAQRVVKCHCV